MAVKLPTTIETVALAAATMPPADTKVITKKIATPNMVAFKVACKNKDCRKDRSNKNCHDDCATIPPTDAKVTVKKIAAPNMVAAIV